MKYAGNSVVGIFRRRVKKYGVRAEFVMSSDIRKLITSGIGRCTRHFSRVERLRRFTLLNDEWTRTGGELASTLNVKRTMIGRR